MRHITLFLFLTVFCSSCNSKDHIKVNNEVYTRTVDEMILNIAYEDQRSEISYKEVILDLQAPIKWKRRYLIPCFEKANSIRIKSNNILSAFTDGHNKEDSYKRLMADSVFFAEKILRIEVDGMSRLVIDQIKKHQDEIGWRTEKIDELIKDIEEIEADFKREKLKALGSINEYEFLLSTVVLQSRFQKFLRGIEEILKVLTYSHTYTEFDMYFPIIFESNAGNLEVGDSLKISIGIGSYSTFINPSELRIMVDGDTLTVSQNATAEYSKRITKRGNDSLKINCMLLNSLTGEVIEGDAEYAYKIK